VTLLLGLTGSAGMGKSTVAAMLRRQGVPVFDADAAVHRLQGPGGALLPAIEALHPGTTGSRGVDRQALGAAVLHDRAALRRLERLIHPAVAAERRRFVRRHGSHPLVALDIPLLFETGSAAEVDRIAVVSAAAWQQRRRLLARPGMTGPKLARIRALQWADARKRSRADVVIPTGGTKARTRAAVVGLVACLRASLRR